MASGTLENLGADRGIGAGIADHVRLDGCQPALRIAPHLVAHGDGVTLGVETNRLLAVERDLDGALGHAGQQGGLSLNGHVLFAPERATVGDELDLQLLLVDTQDRGNLTPIIEDSLSLGVELQATVGKGLGEGAFGLQIEVLDPLGPPGAAHRMGAGSEGVFRVSSLHPGFRQEILVLWIDSRGTFFESSNRFQDRLQDFVLHLHQLGRLSRGGLVLGGYGGQNVADTAHFLSLSDEDRPIAVEKADPAIPGNILGAGYGHDSRHKPRGRSVDPHYPGPGMW